MNWDQNKIENLSDNWRAVGFLTANYQGRFAAINILGQLQSIDYKKTELEATKHTLKQLATMIAAIKDGNAIFFPTPEEIEDQTPEELKRRQDLLLEIVNQLKLDLNDRAVKTEQYLALQYSANSEREAHYLLSGYGWYAYARDNYARGMAEIADFIGDSLLKESFEALKQECAEEIKLTNDFLKAIKRGDHKRGTLFEHVWFFCRTLPGIFRANCHDLNLLLGFREPTFTFSHAAFSSEEELAWSTAGFTPEVAGYWRAHGMSPEKSLIWLQSGISDPKLAAEWASAGFSSEVASTWIAVQFNPLLAIQWYNAGYLPEQAAFLINKGYHHPNQIKPELIPELVKEYEARNIRKAKTEEEAWFGTAEDSEEDQD